MENLSHSRHPNRSKKTCGNAAVAAAPKSLYDDVYGGPPKFSATAAKTTNHLSPRMEDYSEIFGSFQASRTSSIPVLDLPAVDESEVYFDARRSSVFDYAEIFGGGFEGFDFAVSYEDLINGNSSDDAWSPAAIESMSEESDISGKNRYFSNGGPQHRLNGDTEFNITYHQSQKFSGEDVTSGTTHVAELHSVPGYSVMVNSPSQLPESKVTADYYLDIDFGTEIPKSKQLKKAKSSSSNGSTDGNGFERGIRHQKGHGKDGSSHRNSFLDISGINLQTQPLDLPPPSRPPPAVGGKKADSDNLGSKSDRLAFEGIVGDSSPTFFDVEIDASSSAAVSAAAIKEAVEKAQVRLKSAKELMEKKKEGLKRSHKSGSKSFTKERASEMVLKDETVMGASERDGGRTETIAKEEKKKASESAFEVPEIFRGEELLSSREKREEVKSEKESRLSSGSCKIDESSDWKEATEFFEIVTADELKKDFEQANSENILLQNIQNNNEAMEISEKQSGNGKTDREGNDVEEFKKKEKVEELSRHEEEHSEKSEEESEVKDRGRKKAQLTHDVCERGVKIEATTTANQLLEPNEKIAEADEFVDFKRTKNTKLTPIVCDNDEDSEEIITPQETLVCEKVETASNEMNLGAAGWQNEVIDKNFKTRGITGNDFMNDPQEINGKAEVIEESGVFEIENLLIGENLKACGFFPENLGATESSCLDYRVKKNEEISSITGEPNAEQVTRSSPKRFESEKQERDFARECRERGEDPTEPQVSLNREVNKEIPTPAHVVKESTESKRKTEADQPIKSVEKPKNHKPVQQEKAYEEVDTERRKREKEREVEKQQRPRKAEEESERDKERESKQTNPKSAQQVKPGQTTKRKEKPSGEEVETERKQRERDPPANAAKTAERKEKSPGEAESERTENERLRRIEEEREREREREKDRMAVDLATVEARERAFGESRERVAVERATAEARQRAMADARERLEKACAEAREKSLAGKTAVAAAESRVRAERAAVERATAEARERAAGRAMAERANFEAKDQVQRSVSDKFSASSVNSRMRQSSSSSDLQNLQSQSSGVSRFHNSSVYGERYEGVEGESAQRCKARLERHRRTTERAAKALAEKNMRDLLAQREQAERNRVAETLDADVRRWSSGKEGNLRALLSTLQYILGPDSGWHPIPLTEVITSAAVKKAYRRATLCVHPDKLQQRGASIHQKYLCEKVFDLLKEGWNKFNSEER